MADKCKDCGHYNGNGKVCDRGQKVYEDDKQCRDAK